MTRLRVLLSEASSLTAREHLTVLGTAGVRVEAMSSDPFALCRWSRWARRLHRCPNAKGRWATARGAPQPNLALGAFTPAFSRRGITPARCVPATSASALRFGRRRTGLAALAAPGRAW